MRQKNLLYLLIFVLFILVVVLFSMVFVQKNKYQESLSISPTKTEISKVTNFESQSLVSINFVGIRSLNETENITMNIPSTWKFSQVDKLVVEDPMRSGYVCYTYNIKTDNTSVITIKSDCGMNDAHASIPLSKSATKIKDIKYDSDGLVEQISRLYDPKSKTYEYVTAKKGIYFDSSGNSKNGWSVNVTNTIQLTTKNQTSYGINVTYKHIGTDDTKDSEITLIDKAISSISAFSSK